MKKIIAFVLCIAFLMTGVAASAETHPKPSIDYFSKLRVRTSDTAYSLKFTKPIDRLFIIWSDTGLEEMMVCINESRVHEFIRPVNYPGTFS